MLERLDRGRGSNVTDVRLAAVVGGLLGLALSRMAFLMFAVEEKNCSDVCPTDPQFWPWAAVGTALGVLVLVGLVAWARRLSDTPQSSA